MSDRRGFTLIELILAIALMLIISSGIVFLYDSGINSWLYGQAYTQLQDTASLCMEQIMEGEYKFDGLREVLEISGADPHSINFIPWWEQKINRINPAEKIRLEKPFNPKAPVPIAQVWNSDKGKYVMANIDFYPKGADLADNNAYVSFRGDIPQGASGRIFFYPDESVKKDIEMNIFWDGNTRQLYRKYRGTTNPLIKMPQDIEISKFNVEYLDATNNIIPPDRLQSLSGLNNPVTALRTFITVVTGKESYTLRSFINIRKKGVAGSGTLVTQGAEISIPDSKEVKTLSLINFFGITENSSMECTISSRKENKTYMVRIEFGLKNNIPWILRCDIEYPRGKVVFSQDIDVSASHGINFLNIDYSGHYDYSFDENIDGEEVRFLADDVIFKVDSCSITGAYLMVR
jgi:prepilin-type N-terminal cleavage/methylation domain-containing protein